MLPCFATDSLLDVSQSKNNSLAKLNSTPLWNLILQKSPLPKVEFKSSYFSFIILYTNMVLPPSGKKSIMNKQKHLKLEDRILIESLLNQHHSFKSIARQPRKDCTTISKEVKNHICFEKIGTFGRAFNDCRIAVLISVLSKSFANIVATETTNLAGYVADARPPVSLAKNIQEETRQQKSL